MKEKVILTKRNSQKIINRLASEIIEDTEDYENLCIVGIKNGGVPIAKKIAQSIKRYESITIPVGELDITFHRDDIEGNNDIKIKGSQINFDLNKKKVILIDDVLHTGRTIRAALDALCDWGRPEYIKLAVLIDREDRRELPIAANFIGKKITLKEKHIIKTDLTKDDTVTYK